MRKRKRTAQCKRERILIVDDCEENCKILREILAPAFECSYVIDSTKAFSLITEKKPDLVVLDYNLSGMGGCDICKMIRDHKSTKNLPVVFVSQTSTVEEKIHAFEHGADDFISGPFHVREFVLRIKARLPEREPDLEAELFAGNLRMDLISRQVCVDGTEAVLTPKQFEILKMLLLKKNQLVTRKECMAEIWGDAKVTLRNMDAQISYLKRKIKKFKGRIIAIPTLGYRLEV